ncbi:uncharacterized protein JCM6883_005650 [Sporobolomyces salmoneus]|uniref:uncharacterized protein n=1 Tax=Sporobolomyces salmoneus TaxID=183962 RepID=UPI00317C6012
MLSLLRTPLRSSPRSIPQILLRHSSSSSSSFPSRSYPGLYFHPSASSSSSSPSYSLSFLPTPAPSLSFSPTTIGQLSPPSSSSAEPEILPRYFRENPQFLDLVHEVLREEIMMKGDHWVESLAKSIVRSSLEGGVDTYIHIGDQRSPSGAQRTAQPQDIIASILVRGKTGEIVPESYERNRVAYRVVSEMGLMKLPEGLMEKLVGACERNSSSYAPAATRMDNKLQNTGSNQPFHATGDSVPSQSQADQARQTSDGEGHFNQVTQKWEPNGQRQAIETSQGASTNPADGGPEEKVSFKDQVGGFAKKFAGKATGKEHEVAQGEALLNGASKEQAENIAQQVKQT